MLHNFSVSVQHWMMARIRWTFRSDWKQRGPFDGPNKWGWKLILQLFHRNKFLQLMESIYSHLFWHPALFKRKGGPSVGCRHLCPQGTIYNPVPDPLFIIVWHLESHFISLNFNNLQSNIWITAPTLSSLPPQKCWVSEEVIIDTLHVKPCFCEKAEE